MEEGSIEWGAGIRCCAGVAIPDIPRSPFIQLGLLQRISCSRAHTGGPWGLAHMEQQGFRLGPGFFTLHVTHSSLWPLQMGMG